MCVCTVYVFTGRHCTVCACLLALRARVCMRHAYIMSELGLAYQQIQARVRGTPRSLGAPADLRQANLGRASARLRGTSVLLGASANMVTVLCTAVSYHGNLIRYDGIGSTE